MAGPEQTEGAPRSPGASLTVSEISGLATREAQALAQMRGQTDRGDQETAGAVQEEVQRLINSAGRAWILRQGQAVAGYASIMPAPGLPGLYELDGMIAPAQRRRGLASFLLATLVERLADSGVSQLFYAAPNAATPAARFLLENGFFVEHEERRLVLTDLSALPAADLDRPFSLLTFGRRQAIAHFRQLYQDSFAGLAWYQPYVDDREVAREMDDPGDLLFLAEGRRPVGFLWLRWPDLRSAEIEPVGLLPAYQGRGLGRQLMLAGLERAAQQGAEQVWVGAWRRNTPAMTLYRNLGFRPIEGKLFLAYDLQPPAEIRSRKSP